MTQDNNSLGALPATQDRATHEPSPQAVLAVPVGIPSAGCEICADPDDPEIPYYPMYGVAPHECFWRKGPEYSIGQSTLTPFTPEDCFVPELFEGENWSDFRYPAATGVFYCPNCNREAYERAWSELIERVGPPPAEVGVCPGHAQGMSAETAMTEGHGAKPASPVGAADAPEHTPL